MAGVFITGTDTGVGKTVVTAAMLAGLRARGVDAVPMKPVQTGCSGESADLAFCLRTANLNPPHAEWELMCPYLFEPACSPHLAAAKAGTTVSMTRIIECHERLKKLHETIVIEGAGGLLVPLNDQESMRDLVTRLALPLVVVARPGLGTLNHTLLTLHSLRASSLNVEAVLLCDSTAASDGEIEHDNLQTLKRICGVPLVARFPHCPSANTGCLSASDLDMTASVIQPLLDHLTCGD